MEQTLNFWLLGGDRRELELARLLAADGHRVHTCALGGTDSSGDIRRADAVILPMPVCTDGALTAPLISARCPLSPILDRLTPDQFLCGGRVDGPTAELAAARGLTIRDYFAREELAVANAVPTAEGALQLAMEHLPITIHGARVLILGFGRVGRVTAQRFHALGARVTVAARKREQLAWARAEGFGAEHLARPGGCLDGHDLIVNTVPARLLGRRELASAAPGCLILDLSSLPGGVDFAAAEKLGLTAIHALALPGKVAPVTAAQIVRDTVYNMVREHSV